MNEQLINALIKAQNAIRVLKVHSDSLSDYNKERLTKDLDNRGLTNIDDIIAEALASLNA